MGRKTKYQPETMPGLLEDYMAEGLSFEACCGELGVSKDTGYEWVKRYPEFAEAKLLGEARGQTFWERKAIKNLELGADQKFNATVFVFTMKNRFGWRDRKEISGSLGVGLTRQFQGLTNEQIEQRIGEILSRLPKPKGK